MLCLSICDHCFKRCKTVISQKITKADNANQSSFIHNKQSITSLLFDQSNRCNSIIKINNKSH